MQNVINDRSMISFVAQLMPPTGKYYIDFAIKNMKAIMGIKADQLRLKSIKNALITHAKIAEGIRLL